MLDFLKFIEQTPVFIQNNLLVALLFLSTLPLLTFVYFDLLLHWRRWRQRYSEVTRAWRYGLLRFIFYILPAVATTYIVTRIVAKNDSIYLSGLVFSGFIAYGILFPIFLIKKHPYPGVPDYFEFGHLFFITIVVWLCPLELCFHLIFPTKPFLILGSPLYALVMATAVYVLALISAITLFIGISKRIGRNI